MKVITSFRNVAVFAVALLVTAAICSGQQTVPKPKDDKKTNLADNKTQRSAPLPAPSSMGDAASDDQSPEAEAILSTGIKVTIHEAMTEEYVESVAEAIRKVVHHYAVG